MSSLAGFVEKQVVVITTDGRMLVGKLMGFDQTTNLILAETQERVITPDEPTETIEMGLYLIRGDTVAVCGLVDEELEKDIEWTKVRGSRLISTKHTT
ncbi:U6 snRNA-associated Sm-like protein LSm8 [Trichomonascus vanleenenianus]|uniref:U4/U6-U5 snRNP complex subunit LSM8 n=1 Tax=Trichomonascus vanleenenianus TaxID=2268995 RepID=UPI003ECAD01D